MTDAELQAIEERANKASTAPWIVEADEYSGRNWLIGGSAWDNKTYFVTTQNIHASELEGDARTDAEFIAAARTDVPALIAEVRALRAKLDAVPVYVAGVVGAASLVSFEDFYTFVTGIGTDTDTSADGLVIPDDGSDE